jgi:holo-[acyl-carrier protein] synthase
MATQIGFDLVAVDDVRRMIAEHGERYLRRVYTGRELLLARRSPRRLAACFAAKEATVKALDCRDDRVWWHAIELVIAADGVVPTIRLTGVAAALARYREVDRMTVTITHPRDHAAAIVTAKGGR